MAYNQSTDPKHLTNDLIRREIQKLNNQTAERQIIPIWHDRGTHNESSGFISVSSGALVNMYFGDFYLTAPKFRMTFRAARVGTSGLGNIHVTLVSQAGNPPSNNVTTVISATTHTTNATTNVDLDIDLTSVMGQNYFDDFGNHHVLRIGGFGSSGASGAQLRMVRSPRLEF